MKKSTIIAVAAAAALAATIGTANAGFSAMADIGSAAAESQATTVVLKLCSTTTCPAKEKIKAVKKRRSRLRRRGRMGSKTDECFREHRIFKRHSRDHRKSKRHAREHRKFERKVRQLRKSEHEGCNVPDHPKTIEANLRLTREERVLVQRGLNAMKHEAGTDDGLFGLRTREAIRRYQSATRSAKTGYLTENQAKALIEEGRAREDTPLWT